MQYSYLPGARVLVALGMLFCHGATAFDLTETTDQFPAITLQKAVSRALANNPNIKASRLEIDVQRARRDARARPTPYRLDAEIENLGGSDSLSGFDSAETTLQVSRTLELGDKRLYRTELGEAELNLAEIEAAAVKLELTAEVSRRYAELLKVQERLKLVAESVEISNRTLEIVQRRVAAGRASEAEESTARVALFRTDLVAKRIQFEMAGLRVRLSSLWGSTAPDFFQAKGDISTISPFPDYAKLESRLAENPGLKNIATKSQILNARRRLAQSQQRPDIELSAGVRHLAATDDMAFVVSFSLPFGSSRRAEPLIRETDAAIAGTPVAREGLFVDLQSALFSFYQNLEATQTEYVTLRKQIIPEAEKAVRFYERGFELGSYSLLELTAAQERLLTLRGEALNAAASSHITLIEIESLLGNISPGGALK